VIESECAALAARHAKRAQVDAITEALQQMEAMANGEQRQPLAADRLFHLRIAEATGNGALVAVVKMLWDERTGPLFARLEHHYDSPDQWSRAIAEHRAVLEAIGKRDADGSRAAMQRHLDKAYKRFSRSWDAKH
jgi:DNA-binding FadR family transcriptional regulator